MLVVTLEDDWTTYFTAIGTVAAATAAVGIAWWGDRRTGTRLRQERQEALLVEACQINGFYGQ
jgi:hypothetical protein